MACRFLLLMPPARLGRRSGVMPSVPVLRHLLPVVPRLPPQALLVRCVLRWDLPCC